MGNRFLLGIALLAGSPALQAQSVDSGALMRQQQPPMQAPQPQEKPQEAQTLQVESTPPDTAHASRSGEKVFVSRFMLTQPSPLIGEEPLNELLKEFTGHDNTLADLNT